MWKMLFPDDAEGLSVLTTKENPPSTPPSDVPGHIFNAGGPNVAPTASHFGQEKSPTVLKVPFLRQFSCLPIPLVLPVQQGPQPALALEVCHPMSPSQVKRWCPPTWPQHTGHEAERV